MSGAMRRIGEYLGLLEDTGRYDDEYESSPSSAGEEPTRTREPVAVSAVAAGRSPQARPAPVADINEHRKGQAVSNAQPQTSSVTELSRIMTLTPTTYNEARAIGEHYRAGTPVIMNLSEMSDADAKRLVDFAAGLIFATYGDIERVTNKVFLLSPANVAVTAEDKLRIAEGGFFNQS